MSLRDTSKALRASFASSAPLPEELHATIETFLTKHPNIDDNDSHRINEDLLNIYQKYVEAHPGKHGPFVSVLRQLRPSIKTQTQLDEWWDVVIKPTIDTVGQKRDTVEDAREFILSILVFDAEEDKNGEKAQLSAHFLGRLLEAYLVRSRIPSDGEAPASPEDDFIAHEIKAVLTGFGRKKPKELLIAINDTFAKKQSRAQALGLLSSFVRLQPPHLYLVLETGLIDNLLRCLLIDTSTTVVDLALTVLIMFLPHITSVLVSYLPRLLLIYTRILCWDRYGNSRTNRKESIDSETIPQPLINGAVHALESDHTWDELQQSFGHALSTAPRVEYFFTFLYGLFPINFIDFIRKPRKYLKQANLPGAGNLDFDQDLVRTRTEAHRRVHLLHSGFYTSTAEDELNPDRWLQSEPADLVTECMGLRTASTATLQHPGLSPTSRLPGLPSKDGLHPKSRGTQSDAVQDDVTLVDGHRAPSEAGHSKASWRNTHSTAHGSISSVSPFDLSALTKVPLSPLLSKIPVTPVPPDSPTLPPTVLHDSRDWAPEVTLAQSRKPSVISTRSKDPSSPQLDSFADTLSRAHFPSPPSRSRRASISDNADIATLQRELMLLRNDLNFERYLKQQHLSHIGQLQRNQIKGAATDAETQNLIITNRTLKQKLTKSQESYMTLKRDVQNGRSAAKKWENELSSKVRTYREEEKQWQSETQSLRLEYEKLKRDSEHLRRMVVESEARELLSQQKLRALEQDLAELERIQKEVATLQEKLRAYERRELEFAKANRERDILTAQLDQTNMKLNSRDYERDCMAQAYERKIQELEQQLKQTPPTKHGQLPPSMQQMLDNALAASQAQMTSLKRAHQRLLAKHTDLEARFAELDQDGPAGGRTSRAQQHDFERPSDPTSAAFRRQNSVNSVSSSANRSAFFRPHAFADPNSGPHTYEEDAYGGPSLDRTHSTSTSSGNPSTSFSGRPARFESLQYRQGRSHSPAPDAIFEYEGDHTSQHQSSFLHDSSYEGDADMGLRSTPPIGTVTPKSQVRVYGRGGHQNIGKKVVKDKADDKDKKISKTSKFGGLRSMRALAP